MANQATAKSPMPRPSLARPESCRLRLRTHASPKPLSSTPSSVPPPALPWCMRSRSMGSGLPAEKSVQRFYEPSISRWPAPWNSAANFPPRCCASYSPLRVSRPKSRTYSFARARQAPLQQAAKRILFWNPGGSRRSLTSLSLSSRAPRRIRSCLSRGTLRRARKIPILCRLRRHGNLRLRPSAQQSHNLLVQLRACYITLVGAGDIPDLHLHSRRGRPQMNHRGRGQRFPIPCGLLPFFLGLRSACPCLFLHQSLDRLHQRIRILPLPNLDLQFVPQPLSGRRKIKIVSLDRKAVHECDFASRRVPGISPVAGFK